MPDFRMQPSFPISDVINATQRKAQLDNQQTMAQSEMFNQSLEAIGKVGASLLDRRKRMAQAMLLSQQPEVKDMLSGGDRQVTTGPDGQPVRIDQTAAGGVGTEPVQNNPAMTQQNAALLLEGQDPLAVMKQAFARKQAMNPIVDKVAQTDAAGNIIGYSNVSHVKGAKTLFTKPQPVGANSKDERQRQLAAAKVKDKALGELSELSGGFNQIRSLFDKQQELAQKGLAGGPVAGNISKLVAKVTGGGLGTEDIKAFEDFKTGLVARLKRVSGDTGVLTENDATRLIGLLSSLTEDPKTSRVKLGEIESIFSGAKARAEGKANTLMREIQSGNNIPNVDTGATFGASDQQPGIMAPPVAASPVSATAPTANPDLAHLSTKELMDLRAKMTAHKEQKK